MGSVRNNGQAGFTLVKTLITMALIVIFMAATIVPLAYYIPTHRLKSAVQEIDIQFQKARNEAIYRKAPIAIGFFVTEPGGAQKYGPIIWVDSNYNSSNPAHPLLEEGEEVLFRLPVTELPGSRWEFHNYEGIRFNHAQAGPDQVGDGVTFVGNAFVLDRWGQCAQSGSVFLMNARGQTREVKVMLDGTVRVL